MLWNRFYGLWQFVEKDKILRKQFSSHMLVLWPEKFWKNGSDCTHKRDVGRLANWLWSLKFGIMNSSPNFSLTELPFCCSILQGIRSCWLWKIQMWVDHISRACLPTELWKTPIRQLGVEDRLISAAFILVFHEEKKSEAHKFLPRYFYLRT